MNIYIRTAFILILFVIGMKTNSPYLDQFCALVTLYLLSVPIWHWLQDFELDPTQASRLANLDESISKNASGQAKVWIYKCPSFVIHLDFESAALRLTFRDRGWFGVLGFFEDNPFDVEVPFSEISVSVHPVTKWTGFTPSNTISDGRLTIITHGPSQSWEVHTGRSEIEFRRDGPDQKPRWMRTRRTFKKGELSVFLAQYENAKRILNELHPKS